MLHVSTQTHLCAGNARSIVVREQNSHQALARHQFLLPGSNLMSKVSSSSKRRTGRKYVLNKQSIIQLVAGNPDPLL